MSSGHRSSEAYGAFAYAYDKALGERFFKAVRTLLEAALDSYPTREKTHLDVACGTALAVQFFRDRGWSSTGVDASVDMLLVGRGRASRLIAGDFRSLPLRTTFARVTCLYDSLNHVRDRNELVAAFRSVHALMNDQSQFLFDFNHPDMYPEIWGLREPFVAAGRDYRLEISTAFRPSDATAFGLVTGWAVIAGGRRVEISERHRQRAWTEREIVEALGDASLRVVEMREFDPFESEGRPVKLFFVTEVL
jgi:SAM-dependent methyltransferase